MKEILFRGKRITGEWIIGSLIIFGERKFIYQINGSQEDYHFYGYEVIPETVGQFTGLTDKNGIKIFDNGQLLRIKGNMGDNGEYSFDCIFKTNKLSFEGFSLSFLKLFDETIDSKENSFPISQYPSFENRTLGWYDDCKLMIKNTYGENTLSRRRWQEHHKTTDIEVIEN